MEGKFSGERKKNRENTIISQKTTLQIDLPTKIGSMYEWKHG